MFFSFEQMGPSILVAINHPRLFTSYWKTKKEKEKTKEQEKKPPPAWSIFSSRSQPPSTLAQPAGDIYIGIFSPTPTFITVYVRYRRAFVAFVEGGKKSAPVKRAALTGLIFR